MECATVTIRPGQPEELDIFADFWLAMFEEIGIIFERDMAPGWRRRFRDYFERRIADGDARLYVACENGTIVGTAGAIVADGYPFEIHRIARGYVFGVRVDPQYRNGGIATRLTESAVRFLRDAGCKKIRLHASPFGRRIYERLGFVPTNEMEFVSP
jgi:GNAT superfamily N-acetyltransferase